MPFGRFRFHRHRIGRLDADGSTLATPSVDSKIYVWDAATGTRKTLLEGCTNSDLHAAFHPAGMLLASNGYEARLRFWDPVLGRSWFSLGVPYDPYFSQDGRIAVSIDDKLTICQVDPAVEYRILAHASTSPPGYQEPSVRGDGRVLAVGTNTGAVLWDLAQRYGACLLADRQCLRVMFEPSGNLLTSGSAGVVRWPVRIDQERREFRIGPPRKLPLPASTVSSTRTEWVGPSHSPTAPTSASRPPGVCSAWARLTIAVAFRSAPTGNGWRPAVMLGGPRVEGPRPFARD